MGRDTNKIASIAENAVEQAINDQDLLHPEIKKGSTYPFFDGEILVYKNKNQKKENYSGRIPVQIKGREVNVFRKHDCCHFRVERDDLEAYKKETGIIFFVVDILEKTSPETKEIYWKQLLPYEIDLLFKKMKKNSIPIELKSLKSSNLTHVCQNFIRDREKQQHGIIKTLGEIDGIKGFDISVITGIFGKGDSALNGYIKAGNPLYVYAKGPNDISFPVANLIDDGIHFMLRSNEEVWVDGKSYGKQYISQQMNKNGNYLQFGSSWCFLPEGQAKFSESGTLESRISDTDFFINVVRGGEIRIGDMKFPYNLQPPPDRNTTIYEFEQRLEVLQTSKRVLDFLGMNIPVDIATFGEKDFHLLYALSERMADNNECPAIFKNDGFKVLWIGKYPFLVLASQKRIINVFCQVYDKAVRTVLNKNDGTEERISPYCYLNSEAIAKSANFNGDVVMESIKQFSYSSASGGWYNGLLLETIKAVDIASNNKRVVKFANDLADYLIENEDSTIHRLNKMQIHKRFTPLEKKDIDWLLAERGRQDDSRILCGIAVLLEDTALFDEHFAKLTPEMQEEFRMYPIMKLHNIKPIPR